MIDLGCQIKYLNKLRVMFLKFFTVWLFLHSISLGAQNNLLDSTGVPQPRGLALKIKAQRLFPSDKFMGVFSGSRQVNALRGVCGSNGGKRVVCRQRWEVFGCCIEEGAFWGYYFILFDYYKVVYGCIE